MDRRVAEVDLSISEFDYCQQLMPIAMEDRHIYLHVYRSQCERDAQSCLASISVAFSSSLKTLYLSLSELTQYTFPFIDSIEWRFT